MVITTGFTPSTRKNRGDWEEGVCEGKGPSVGTLIWDLMNKQTIRDTKKYKEERIF